MTTRNQSLLLTSAIAASLVLAGAGQARALAPATAQAVGPQTAPAAQAQSLPVRITGVDGDAQVREANAKDWKSAKVGMLVSQGAEFRTGLRGSIQFVIGKGHVVTVDRLSTVKVLRAIENAGIVKTDIGMEYGRTDYNIEAGGAEHESTIQSPGATLAVRDTRWIVTDTPPYIVSVDSIYGNVNFKPFGQPAHTFGGNHPTQVDSQNTDPATYGYGHTNNPAGDDHGALTNPEQGYWNEYPGYGPDVHFGFLTSFHSSVTNGTLQNIPTLGPNTGAFVQATLSFLLVASPSAGVNLLVVSPLGETLGATGLPTFMGGAPQPQVSSGGQLTINQATGTKAVVVQTATWNQFFPAGTFTVGAVDTGTAPAKFTVEAVINGTVTNKTFSGTLNPGSTYTTKQVKLP